MTKHNTWIEINRDNLLHNLRYFRSRIEPEVKIASVVKANAYGHGIDEVSSIIAKETDFLAVHSLEEALRIKNLGKPILILGYVNHSEIGEAIENSFHIAVFNLETLQDASVYCLKRQLSANVHLKIETGTNRLGFTEGLLKDALHYIRLHPEIKVRGAYTHYANIEDTTNHSFASSQLSCFKDRLRLIEEGLYTVDLPHTSCSAASLLFAEAHFRLIRIGISLYGLWPSKETLLSFRLKEAEEDMNILKPVMSLKTIVAQLKWVEEGSFIGYGCTYRATHKTRLAILPVGYYDGIDRKLSNNGYVLIRGKRAPIRGRVCMDLTIVEVTDIQGISLEDNAVIIGSSEKEHISAEDHASWAGTINYEVVARIGNHIPRRII